MAASGSCGVTRLRPESDRSRVAHSRPKTSRLRNRFMSFDARTLYQLLPAVYRIRDAEQGGPLQALLTVIGEQAQVMEEDLAQLYDDLFIETCAQWIIPYIGDLIGVASVDPNSVLPGSTRAEVANTFKYLRAKRTLTVVEDLFRDVTAWGADAEEYFPPPHAPHYLQYSPPGT